METDKANNKVYLNYIFSQHTLDVIIQYFI